MQNNKFGPYIIHCWPILHDWLTIGWWLMVYYFLICVNWLDIVCCFSDRLSSTDYWFMSDYETAPLIEQTIIHYGTGGPENIASTCIPTHDVHAWAYSSWALNDSGTTYQKPKKSIWQTCATPHVSFFSHEGQWFPHLSYQCCEYFNDGACCVFIMHVHVLKVSAYASPDVHLCFVLVFGARTSGNDKQHTWGGQTQQCAVVQNNNIKCNCKMWRRMMAEHARSEGTRPIEKHEQRYNICMIQGDEYTKV